MQPTLIKHRLYALDWDNRDEPDMLLGLKKLLV